MTIACAEEKESQVSMNGKKEKKEGFKFQTRQIILENVT